MPPIAVALMDDNDMLAEAMERFIAGDHRFVWVGAADGRDRLVDLLARTRADVLLVDVDLPGTDTFGLVRDLAAGDRPTKAVMFSGHVRREYVDAAMDAGAFGYLSKDDDLASIFDGLVQVHAGAAVFSAIVRQVLGTA
jgi:DNA-binding NarL/FixJ family response regulator